MDFSWVMYNSFYSANQNAKESAKITIDRLYRLREMYPDSPMIYAMDSSGSFRHELYENYKEGRSHPDGVFEYKKQIMETLSLVYGTLYAQMPGWESDDIIYTLIEMYRDYKKGVIIFSQDQDFMQFIGNKVKIFHKIVSGKIVTRTMAEVEKSLKYHPTNMNGVKTICGDPHNNVKGIPRFYKSYAEDICKLSKKLKVPVSEIILNKKYHNKLETKIQRALDRAQEKYPELYKQVTLREELIPLRLVPNLELIKIKGKKDSFDFIFN